MSIEYVGTNNDMSQYTSDARDKKDEEILNPIADHTKTAIIIADNTKTQSDLAFMLLTSNPTITDSDLESLDDVLIDAKTLSLNALEKIWDNKEDAFWDNQ